METTGTPGAEDEEGKAAEKAPLVAALPGEPAKDREPPRLDSGGGAAENSERKLSEAGKITHIVFGAWIVLWRAAIMLTWATAVYVVVGCIRYPTWWYSFIWRRGWSHPRNYLAVVQEMNRVPLQAAFTLLLACAGFIFLYRRRRRLLAFMDEHGGISILVAVVAMGVTALLVNASKKREWELLEMGKKVVDLAEVSIDLMASVGHVSLDPPLAFYYIDQKAVDGLVAQLEPDLVEKTRIEKQAQKAAAKVSVGVGGSSASAERNTNTDATSQFERTAASPERRTAQLIHYCLEQKRAALIQGRLPMIMDIGMRDLRRRLGVVRAALEDPIDPVLESEMERQHEEIRNAMKKAEQEVDDILSSPPDLLVVALSLARREAIGTDRRFEGFIESDPRKITIDVFLPEAAELPAASGKFIDLRVFGRFTGRSASGAIVVKAIAVF